MLGLHQQNSTGSLKGVVQGGIKMARDGVIKQEGVTSVIKIPKPTASLLGVGSKLNQGVDSSLLDV